MRQRETELLDAIAARPHDDELRLLYADLLLGRGEPKGELIGVQCTLERSGRSATRLDGLLRAPPSRHGPVLDAARHAALTRREAELLVAHAGRWTAEAGLSESLVAYRRGFIDDVAMHAAHFLANEEAFFRLRPLPGLRLVRVDVNTTIQIAGLPSLDRLTALEVESGSNGDIVLKALCASPRLRALRSLRVPSSRVGAAGMRAIARAVSISGLERLDVTHGALGDAAVPAIVAVLDRMPLVALVLRRNDLEPGGARALAAAQSVRSLEELNLAGCWVGDEGATALAASPTLARLRRLVLWFDDLGPEAAKAIAVSDHLAGLEELDVGANSVGDAGARAIASMPKLRILGLARAEIGDAGADALAERQGDLERLDLRNNPIGARSVARLRERFGDRVLVGRAQAQ